MAAVGVASFPRVYFDQSTPEESGRVDIQESLLLDLMNASLGHLCVGGDHVTYDHEVIRQVMETGHAQLRQAVVLSLPLLFRAVAGYWSASPPPTVQDKLVCLVSGLLEQFNRY